MFLLVFHYYRYTLINYICVYILADLGDYFLNILFLWVVVVLGLAIDSIKCWCQSLLCPPEKLYILINSADCLFLHTSKKHIYVYILGYLKHLSNLINTNYNISLFLFVFFKSGWTTSCIYWHWYSFMNLCSLHNFCFLIVFIILLLICLSYQWNPVTVYNLFGWASW